MRGCQLNFFFRIFIYFVDNIYYLVCEPNDAHSNLKARTLQIGATSLILYAPSNIIFWHFFKVIMPDHRERKYPKSYFWKFFEAWLDSKLLHKKLSISMFNHRWITKNAQTIWWCLWAPHYCWQSSSSFPPILTSRHRRKRHRRKDRRKRWKTVEECLRSTKILQCN